MREAIPLVALFAHAKISKGATEVSTTDVNKFFDLAYRIIAEGEKREKQLRHNERISELKNDIERSERWLKENDEPKRKASPSLDMEAQRVEQELEGAKRRLAELVK